MKSNNILIRKVFDNEAFQKAALGSPCSLCFFKNKVKTADCSAEGIPPCRIHGVDYYFAEVETGDQSPEGYSLYRWLANNTKF